jgi:DNA-binding NarL/FixJ family response regulator
MKKISILIADDHKLIREAWAHILNSDPRFEVIGTCGNAEEAIEIARTKIPDIILMDINMTPVSGLEATQEIRKISPTSKIIGVSMHSQPAYARKMLHIGGRGYVTKNSSKQEMIQAIVEVSEGRKYICEEIRNIISDQMVNDKEDAQGDINALTEREMQIINQIKQGKTSKEIAMGLQITIKTVEVHRHNILKKLKLKNAASLVNFINTRESYI